MPFKSNVRATFHFRRFAKMASVVALAVTFFISFWISTESNPVGAYVLFLIAAVNVGLIYYVTTRERVNIFETDAFLLARIFRPIGLGLSFILAAYFLIFVLFRLPITEGSVQEKAAAVFFWAILVGFVEEFVRWTWLQTLPYSVLTANLLWVILHPQVATLFNGGSPNLFFAFVAFSFGLAMTGAMYLYETPLRSGFNTYLGPVFAMTLHAGFNAFTVLWAFEIVVPGAGPTTFPPMAAAAVVAIGLLLVVVCRWRSSIRTRS